MTFVVGRGATEATDGPTGRLGTYRALDGSSGAPLLLDLDGPHACLVVGKRGYGKSYTLGVIAEALARTPGVAPVVVDPMGVFRTLAGEAGGDPVPVDIVASPAVAPGALDPRSWCTLLGLSPESGAGSLVWQAAQESSTLPGMRSTIESTTAPDADRRAATNHLTLAERWDIFDTAGLDARALGGSEVTVLDVSGLDAAPMNAVVRAVGEALYRARIDDDIERLPWLLVDEAHTFFDGVAAGTLRLLLTRGRAPGVSLVLATQRPSGVADVCLSQSDILVAHRLTAQRDIEPLRAAQPTYMSSSLAERMPSKPGGVLVVDDATETVHAAQIRERATPHGGDSPRASDVSVADGTSTEFG